MKEIILRNSNLRAVEKEAALTYDKAAKKYFKEFARVNTYE